MLRRVIEAKASIIAEQFKFVKPYLETTALIKVPVVRRVNLELLSSEPHDEDTFFRRYIFFDDQGNEMAEAKVRHKVRLVPFSLRNPFTWIRKVIPAETVQDVITRLHRPDQLRYILEVSDESLIVHKVPSGMTVGEWMGNLKRAVMADFRNEMAKADETRLDRDN